MIDSLIRRVAETGGADDQVLRLLHDHDPRLGAAGCDPAAVEAKLRQVVAARGPGGRPS